VSGSAGRAIELAGAFRTPAKGEKAPQPARPFSVLGRVYLVKPMTSPLRSADVAVIFGDRAG
jgi:hypothetical protein